MDKGKWDKIKSFYKITFIILPFTVLGIGGVTYLIYKFAFVRSDAAIAITNVAFAVVAALSAICFNWSRSITDDNDRQDFAYRHGANLFLSAILFLVLSGLKYCFHNFTRITGFHEHWFELLAAAFFGAGFGGVFWIVYWSLFRIANRIFDDGNFGPPGDLDKIRI